MGVGGMAGVRWGCDGDREAVEEEEVEGGQWE